MRLGRVAGRALQARSDRSRRPPPARRSAAGPACRWPGCSASDRGPSCRSTRSWSCCRCSRAAGRRSGAAPPPRAIPRRRRGSPDSRSHLTIASPLFASPRGGFFTANSCLSEFANRYADDRVDLRPRCATASSGELLFELYQKRGIQVVGFTARGLRIQFFTQSGVSFESIFVRIGPGFRMFGVEALRLVARVAAGALVGRVGDVQLLGLGHDRPAACGTSRTTPRSCFVGSIG